MKKLRDFRDAVISDFNRYGIKAPLKSKTAMLGSSFVVGGILLLLIILLFPGCGYNADIEIVRTGELGGYKGEAIADYLEGSELIQDYSWNSFTDEKGKTVVEFHGGMGLIGYYEALLEEEGMDISLRGSRFEVLIQFIINENDFTISYTGLEILLKGDGEVVHESSESLNRMDVITTLHDGEGDMLWSILQFML